MNENLNLIEILKDCPKGTKLYSTIYGKVEFDGIKNGREYPVKYVKSDGTRGSVTAQGLVFARYDSECTLFPSKEQRDWSKFKQLVKPKFDPKTLCPFEKVLVRDKDYEDWTCGFFSHKDESTAYPYRCIGTPFMFCIPYNDDTKHLVGTADEAPEYYRYWEV